MVGRFGKHGFVLLCVVASWSSQVWAGDVEDAEKAETARQEAFRSGMEIIVNDLNESRYDTFLGVIDKQELINRIFGLRLIDPRAKKQFNENLEYTWDPLIIQQLRETDDGLKVTLLGVESRGSHGRAAVRFDLPKLQFNYHEYDLRLDAEGRMFIVDWMDYLDGMPFSRNVGEGLVTVLASKQALRKLLDFKNPNERELFQLGELLKAARDRKLDRYLEIRDGMNERLQRQRIVVETTVHVARQVRQRRQMIAALEIMSEYYPDEPLYSLMLLDYYFPARKYEEALQALQRMSDRLGFPDAAMDARMSAAALVLDKPQDALAYAEKALEREPGLELAWWSALNARADLADFAGSVAALQRLEGEFGYELGPKALGKNRSYAQLLDSSEYKSWRESLE